MGDGQLGLYRLCALLELGDKYCARIVMSSQRI